ncbi:MAG TPA: thioredoxin family protein [Kofleriaceae bacterium]|nr:thioredoxin family protein [Kofleriaceae bacterium]
MTRCRGFLVALGLAAMVAGARPAAAERPPALDAAIAVAAADGRPLVVELGATWCHPCQVLQSIEADPRVQAALATVLRVHYDVDSADGAAIAEYLDIHGVPAILVLDGGQIVQQYRGLDDASHEGLVAWYLGILADAVAHDSALDRLERDAAAHPADLALGERLGEQYEQLGRIDDAIGAYRAVAAGTPATSEERAVVATAARKASGLAQAQARIDDTIDAAAAVLRQTPAAPEASLQLAVLATADRLSHDQIVALLDRHLAAVAADPAADRFDPDRVAILVGEPERARAMLAARPGIGSTLLAAELDLAEHANVRAVARMAAACPEHDAADPLGCYRLELALASGDLAGVRRLSEAAGFALRQASQGRPAPLRYPVSVGMARTYFLELLATELRRAGRRCGDDQAPATVAVDLVFAPAGGPPSVSPAAQSWSARCVASRLEEAQLPRPPARLATMVDVQVVLGPPALGHRAHPDDAGVATSVGRVTREAPATVGTGALVFGRPRIGAADSITVGVQGVTGAPLRGRLRVVATTELEGGVDGLVGAAFAARAMGGLGARLAHGHAIVSVATGLGVSGTGRDVPAALEVPVELRLQAARGGFRLHGWLRAGFVPGEPVRQLDAPLGVDEVEAGAGFSIPRHLGRFFFGVAVEDEAIGASASICFGLPLGAF